MGCGAKCLKYIMVLFNGILLIAGGVALGLGIWALVSDFGAKEMKELTGSELYQAACITVIVGGGVIFLISFLGCCGAWTENRCMLGLYFFIMLLFLILFVVGAVVSFVFKDDLEDELAKELTNTLQNDYGVDGKSELTAAWNKVQEEFNCCGVRGSLSSSESWFLWQSSVWFTSQAGTTQNPKYVPTSCCVGSSSFNDCQNLNSSPNIAPQTNATAVTQDNPALYEDGCIDKLKDKIDEYIVPIGVIAIVVIVVMLFCIIGSVYVCTQAARKEHVV